jgi:hypothetical protein
VLTSYAPEDLTVAPTITPALLGGGIDALDPLSKDCPDDVPCRVQDAIQNTQN